jgi:hypothetical protein
MQNEKIFNTLNQNIFYCQYNKRQEFPTKIRQILHYLLAILVYYS